MPDLLAVGVGLLHEWLSENPPAPGVRVSERIRAAADAGDGLAQKVIASGLFNDPDLAVEPRPVPAAPVLQHVVARDRREATQKLPHCPNRAEPSRPIVRSGATRPWMRQ